LPGLRQKSHHAEAASDDGSQTDAGAVPTALGVTIVIPFGRPELCEDEISTGEEVWAGSQGSGGAEEGSTKGCPEDGTPEVNNADRLRDDYGLAAELPPICKPCLAQEVAHRICVTVWVVQRIEPEP